MAEKLSPGRRVGQSFGLTVFLCTALFLLALVITRLTDPIDVRGAALVLSTLAATVACLAMLADAFDLWMLGRRMTPFSVRMTHSLVFVSVLVAFLLSLLGKNTLLFVFIAPALAIYLLTVMRPAPARAPARRRRGAASANGRQRRGGRKRS